MYAALLSQFSRVFLKAHFRMASELRAELIHRLNHLTDLVVMLQEWLIPEIL